MTCRSRSAVRRRMPCSGQDQPSTRPASERVAQRLALRQAGWRAGPGRPRHPSAHGRPRPAGHDQADLPSLCALLPDDLPMNPHATTYPVSTTARTAGRSSCRATGAPWACGRPTTGRCPLVVREARSWAPSGRGADWHADRTADPRRGSSPRHGGEAWASRCGPPCWRWPSARYGPTRRSARPSSTTGRRSASRGPSATATRTAGSSSTRGRAAARASRACRVGAVGPGPRRRHRRGLTGPSPLRHRGDG